MELGIIAQSCENYLQQLTNREAEISTKGEDKVEKICKEIISKVHIYPKENNASVEFDKELDVIKSMFRRIQSKLGTGPLTATTSAPSTDW